MSASEARRADERGGLELAAAGDHLAGDLRRGRVDHLVAGPPLEVAQVAPPDDGVPLELLLELAPAELPGEPMRASTNVSDPKVRAVVARAKSASPCRPEMTIATVATPTAIARAPRPERSGCPAAVRAACESDSPSERHSARERHVNAA